jgi:hypothetical protein
MGGTLPDANGPVKRTAQEAERPSVVAVMDERARKRTRLWALVVLVAGIAAIASVAVATERLGGIVEVIAGATAEREATAAAPSAPPAARRPAAPASPLAAAPVDTLRKVTRPRRKPPRDRTERREKPRADDEAAPTAVAVSPGPAARPDRPAEDPGVSTENFDRCDFLDPSACMYPFPNNHFTEADASTQTGRRLSLHRDSMPRNRAGKPIDPADYAASDGFSPGNMIVTKVPGLETLEAFRASRLPPIDDPAQSLGDRSPLVVLNADTLERHLVWAEIDSNAQDPADVTLIVRPGVNFAEGARYIVALRDLKHADGSPIRAGRAFRVYRDGIVTNDAQVEGRRPEMEEILGPLEAAGVRRKDLYLAWDFTVASAPSTTGRMLSIRDRTFSELGDENLADRKVEGRAPTFTVNPDLPDDLPRAPLPEAPVVGTPGPEDVDGIVDYRDGPIARTVRGKITVPCFLDQPGCPTGSRFAIGADGTPTRIPGNTTVYDFTCNMPRDTDSGPRKLRPALYGHGLFGGQGEIFQTQLEALSFEHGFLFCATDWNGMATRDVPNALTILQDLSRFPTLVDHVQQGYLGFLLLGRAMIHPDGFASHEAFQDKIDTRELFYDGNSQGGIYGGALTAIAPDFERAVLGVPGMNYSTLLRRSVDFDLYAKGQVGTDTPFGLYDNYPDELTRPLVLSLIQLLWDRADPNGYAHHMTADPLPNTPSHKVLLHVGFGDHQVADVTTEVQARTIGARVHRPLLADDRPRFRDRPYPDGPSNPFSGVESLGSSYDGSGVVFWDSRRTPPPPAGNVPPREGEDPHELPRRTPAARVQKSEFLRPGGRIVDVCDGAPCQSVAR